MKVVLISYELYLLCSCKQQFMCHLTMREGRNEAGKSEGVSLAFCSMSTTIRSLGYCGILTFPFHLDRSETFPAIIYSYENGNADGVKISWDFFSTKKGRVVRNLRACLTIKSAINLNISFPWQNNIYAELAIWRKNVKVLSAAKSARESMQVHAI